METHITIGGSYIIFENEDYDKRLKSMTKQAFTKKYQPYTFRAEFVKGVEQIPEFLARRIKIRIIQDDKKIESLHLQAEFDYDTVKKIQEHGFLRRIDLSSKEENRKVYCYFNSNEYLRGHLLYCKKKYPYMDFSEVFFDGESTNSFSFNEISYYHLLKWKVAEN